MNPKFEQLKIKSAKNKILEKYNYLNIESLYSSLDIEYNEIYSKYRKLNFNKKLFSFNEGMIINKVKFEEQHIKAIDYFYEKIISLKNTDYIFITIGLNGIGFWAKVKQDIFNSNIKKFIKDYSAEFYFYTFENHGIEIYRAEYAWEVLSTF